MAAMTDTPQTGVPQSGVLCVQEDPCLMGTPQSAAFHIDGSAGYSFFFPILVGERLVNSN